MNDLIRRVGRLAFIFLILRSAPALAQTIQNASFESQDANLDPIGWTEYGGAATDLDAHIYTPPTFGIDDPYDGIRIYGIAQDGTRTGGGIYQQVAGVAPGIVCRAQVWHYTFRTGNGEMRNRIGIDPYGGTDSSSSNVIWSLAVHSDGQWSRIEIDATASASTITVFLQFQQSGSSGFAINYFDLVELIPNPPPPSPCTDGTSSVTLSDRRIDWDDGNLEAQYTVPQGYVITGIGARGSAENVSTMVVEQAPLFTDGSLGQPETVRFGWEPDGPIEACILLPDCYVAVGYGARAAGEYDIFTLAVWARPICMDGTLGAVEEFRAGVEPDHSLEKEFLAEPGRVLTGVGLGMSYSDINRIYAETDLHSVSTTTLMIEVDPSSISQITVVGVNLPNDTFTVTRIGTETLNYTIADNVDWLSVLPTSGTNNGEIDTVQIIYDADGLPVGTHAATITVSDPQALNDPQYVQVSVTVEPVAQTSPGFYKAGWNLTSVPVVPTNPEATAVFQDLVDLGNTIDGNLYRYDAVRGYEMYSADFVNVDRGDGYWLWLSTVDDETVVTVPGTAAGTDVEIPLSEAWNLIGHPFQTPQLLANCQMRNGATIKSFEQAVASGWIAGVLHYWDPGRGYQMARTEPFGHDAFLRPWYGYWAHAMAPDLEMIIPFP